MLDKEKLIECLQNEANYYSDAWDDRGIAIRESNLALIDEINSGRFDIKE